METRVYANFMILTLSVISEVILDEDNILESTCNPCLIYLTSLSLVVKLGEWETGQQMSTR